MNVNRFVSCQDEYSLVVREIEKDLLPAAQEYNLGLLPFFPLASGLLTGKYKRGAAAPDDTRFGKSPAMRERYVTPRNEDIVEKLQAFAQARGHTMLELAFSWLASRPQVSSVIAGATRVEQVEQNVKAIDWALSAEEIAEIDRITKVVSHLVIPRTSEAIEDRCVSRFSLRSGSITAFPARTPRDDDCVPDHPTSPFIGFTGALSGNTVSASTRSARPR